MSYYFATTLELPFDEAVARAVDPVASMQAVGNPDLGEVATAVRDKLRRVIEQVRKA